MDFPGPPAASPRATVARLPLGPGVYRFRDAAGRVLYVGRAVCLRRRVASYWGDLGDRGHLAAMVARIARVEAVPCASAHEAAWLERNLLERRTPPWNRSAAAARRPRSGSGSASPRTRPAWRSPARPGRGDRARYFGPYLGGQKARDAVSGLGRVLPLGPAPRTPRAPPASWPGPRRLPVAPADLALTVAAALDRDPAAVAALRAELIRRRDTAAAAAGLRVRGPGPG